MDHLEQPALTFNSNLTAFLREIAKWTNFIAIVGFIVVGLMVIGALSVGVFMSSFNSMTDMGIPFPPGLLSVVYIIIALVYFFPIYHLYKFSAKIRRGLGSQNEAEVTEAFRFLKSHYKFIGILLIIVLSLYGLLFLIGLLGGAMMF